MLLCVQKKSRNGAIGPDMRRNRGSRKQAKTHFSCRNRVAGRWNRVKDDLGKVEVPGVTFLALDCQEAAELQDHQKSLTIFKVKSFQKEKKNHEKS